MGGGLFSCRSSGAWWVGGGVPGARAPGYHLPPLRGWLVGGATRVVEERRGLRFRRTRRGGFVGGTTRVVDGHRGLRFRRTLHGGLSVNGSVSRLVTGNSLHGWSPAIRGARTCGSQGREPLGMAPPNAKPRRGGIRSSCRSSRARAWIGREPLGLAPHHTLNPGGVTCGWWLVERTPIS